MSDFLSVAFGVVLGVLASVPVALVIAASTARPRARDNDLPALDVPYVELPEKRESAVIVWEVWP